MAAERTLRIVDALAIRAPNAEMPFLEGKVRCQVNHTLEWLSNKPLDEQKNLIDFATSFEKKARKEVKLKKMALASRINAKQRKKVHERDVTERNAISKQIQVQLRQEHAEIDHPGLNTVAPEQLQKLIHLINLCDTKERTECLFVQMWWDQEEMRDKEWKGNIVRVYTKKNTDMAVRVLYWLGDDEEESRYSNYLFSTIIADLILGQLTFIL